VIFLTRARKPGQAIRVGNLRLTVTSAYLHGGYARPGYTWATAWIEATNPTSNAEVLSASFEVRDHAHTVARVSAPGLASAGVPPKASRSGCVRFAVPEDDPAVQLLVRDDRSGSRAGRWSLHPNPHTEI
jgi:hypothetical protein